MASSIFSPENARHFKEAMRSTIDARCEAALKEWKKLYPDQEVGPGDEAAIFILMGPLIP